MWESEGPTSSQRKQFRVARITQPLSDDRCFVLLPNAIPLFGERVEMAETDQSVTAHLYNLCITFRIHSDISPKQPSVVVVVSVLGIVDTARRSSPFCNTNLQTVIWVWKSEIKFVNSVLFSYKNHHFHLIQDVQRERTAAKSLSKQTRPVFLSQPYLSLKITLNDTGGSFRRTSRVRYVFMFERNYIFPPHF